MYLNTKYFLQMYWNTKYIDVFKYFCKYFLILFSKYRPLIHYKFENERNIRHKISSTIQYVNNITDMHVIYYITCLSDIVWGLCCAVCKDKSRDYNDRQCGSDVK